jgi:hypothetical protein
LSQNEEIDMKRFKYFLFSLLMAATILTACAPTAAASPPNATPMPVLTPLSLTLTPTPVYVEATASPLPPSPTLPPMITPDAIQVERWQEYQAELAKGILPMEPIESVLCEWNVLARVGQEVYVWAVCATIHGDDTRPAVIHLSADGSVQGVEIPKRGSLSDFNRLFPEAARMKMNWYVDVTDDSGEGMIRELRSHIEYRKTHPEEPPLIVLSAAPVSTPTLLPTQPPPPILTPDAIQVERWREYQLELAKALFVYNPEFPQIQYDPEEYKDALCEWDILRQSVQEAYVWAVCASADGLSHPSNPAVIYLKPDGSIQKVSVASEKIDRPNPYLIYDLHLFPIEIQKNFCLYYFSGYMPQCPEIDPAYIPSDYEQSRESVLLSYLKYREEHRDEPPLIILSAMPSVTPTP